MTKREYESTVMKIAVHPAGENPELSELTTHVSVNDEGGGPYLVIEQFDDNRKPGMVRIDFDELEVIAAVGKEIIEGMKK